MSKSKNDTAWEKLFTKHKILDEIKEKGFKLITSTAINEFREARLMTKFDHKSQLPELFTNNNLSILPTSRGGYVIGIFDTFCDFNIDETEVSKIDFPSFLESLDYRNISSESTAINCAFVSNILQDFTGEDNLFPTVSGRMSSSSFSFNINSIYTDTGLFSLSVINSQIEIDGGYEGDYSLNLIEAKNYISDDFLIRQLYYPYKLWSGKISKKVRPIFLTYSNGVFHLREYAFGDIDHYNSINLIKHKKYVIRDGTFNIETIESILKSNIIIEEPSIPFPQANSFDRIINLCELLQEREFISKEDITQNYDFDSRQTDYYLNAAKYLGLIDIIKDENGNIGGVLSPKGKQIFNVNLIDRQKEFVKIIIEHSVFNDTLKLYLHLGELPSKKEIVAIMKKSKLHNITSETTYFRRASTISVWIDWIINLIEE